MATSICRSLDRRKTQFRIRVNVTQTNGISIKNKNDITPQFDSFSLGFRLPLTFQATSGGLQRSKKVGIAGSYPHVDAVTLFLSGDARLERCQPLTLNYIKMPCLEKQKKICSFPFFQMKFCSLKRSITRGTASSLCSLILVAKDRLN